MSDLIERVARAIYEAAPFSRPGDFETAPAAVQERVKDQARAAIEAMREPSRRMLLAAEELVVTQVRVDEAALWRAMTDAALDDPRPAEKPDARRRGSRPN